MIVAFPGYPHLFFLVIFTLRWERHSGPSYSKLTMSLVNDLLKFTSNDMLIC